ncbi:MAG: hypothetical protein ABFS18_00825 [Thermodesulfobacteriota bacterium]
MVFKPPVISRVTVSHNLLEKEIRGEFTLFAIVKDLNIFGNISLCCQSCPVAAMMNQFDVQGY